MGANVIRGSRGPIPGTAHKLPAARRSAVSEVPEPRTPPPAPKGLGAPGARAWQAVMAWTPLLLPELDAVSAERFCSLVDERATISAELARGVVLEEPIVTPKGDVVGTRVVANPAAAMLRQIDKALDALADRLGLVPAARSPHGRAAHDRRTPSPRGGQPARRPFQARGGTVTSAPHALSAKDLALEAAKAAAQRIVDAVYVLPPFLRLHLAIALAIEESTTLSTIGESLLGPNPVPTMANQLLAEVFIGDLEQVAPKLGETMPWSAVRAALEDISAAWRAAHPTFRTRHDRSVIAQRWKQETAARSRTEEST